MIGGFCYGGTCFHPDEASSHPRVYPNFVDISGQLEPTLRSRQQTVNTAFGGAKFTASNPRDIMAGTGFPDTSG